MRARHNPGLSVVRTDTAAPPQRLPRARSAPRVTLAVVLLAAFAVRVYGISAGIPYAVGIDEPFIVNHALQILKTGDWNPHFFDYPSLVIYIHTVVAAARFLWGAAHSEWSTLEGLQTADLYEWARWMSLVFAMLTVWLVYRVGKQLDSRWVGVVGAALIAVLPLHVRESHFALTDVPLVTFVTLALLLALRAARRQTLGSYLAAGAVAGLAAATKYNGAIVLVALIAVGLQSVRSRGIVRKAAAGIAASCVAFACAAPYTFLDVTGFLNDFGSLLASVSNPGRALPEPAWSVYLKHLHLADPFWLPVAGLGALFVACHASARRRWLPLYAFVAAYFYVLASHPLVFARYALPMTPVLCLSVAYAVVRATRWIRESWPSPRLLALVPSAVAVMVVAGFAWQSIVWNLLLIQPDTRTIAANWIVSNASPSARVAVEHYGPTNLERAGFTVVSHARLIDRPLEWYASQDVAYLIVSTLEAPGTAAMIEATETMFEARPDKSRWGPAIRIVRLPTREVDTQ